LPRHGSDNGGLPAHVSDHPIGDRVNTPIAHRGQASDGIVGQIYAYTDPVVAGEWVDAIALLTSLISSARPRSACSRTRSPRLGTDLIARHI
jgi:hypothetical protein